jgi:hypothetical protein
VFHWTEGAAAAFEKYRGYPANTLVREQTHWNHLMEEVTKEDWEWLWRGPGLEAQHEDPECVYPGAGRAMRRLATEGDLIVCTHRPKRCAVATAAFMAHHKVQFSELHVLGSHTLKSGVWKDCDVVLEDKISNVQDVYDFTDAQIFVPIRSYNHVELDAFTDTLRVPERIHRYTDLKEVTRWVRAQALTTTR